jgi:ribose 1,5-bisphosphokinase PhnN
MTGHLMLVVGPSGSGKDTLLAAAALSLRNDPRFRFVRRVITRAPGIEGNEAIGEAAFARRPVTSRSPGGRMDCATASRLTSFPICRPG